MAEPQYAPQLANPFLDPSAAPAPTLNFQEQRSAGFGPRLKRVRVADHNLAQGYQAGGGPIGPNTSSAFTQPPGLGYRVPDSAPPLQPAAVFPSVPAAPPPSASSTGGGWFSLKPYAVYFDVDTADVLHRMRLACVPFGSSFMTTVKDKPDLYGPFWIAATLVFIAAAAGNLSSYLAYVKLAGTTPDAVWSYDIKKVSLSAVLFYGYISFLPLSLYLALRYWSAPTSFTALVTLYGYSLVIYLPIAILCVVPVDAVRWPIVLAGGGIASLCLVLNLRRLMEQVEDAKRKSIVLLIAGASQFGLAVGVKMYVFAY